MSKRLFKPAMKVQAGHKSWTVYNDDYHNMQTINGYTQYHTVIKMH